MIEQLNSDHAIDDHIRFEMGQGGLVKAVISNQHADAAIYLHGAHVTHFQPRGQEPLLWMSSQAEYQADAALRGGIPVIWPWFGPHPTDDSKPQHGFVRTMAWSVLETNKTDAGETLLKLGMADNDETRVIWDHGFVLELTVLVGPKMQVSLTTRNNGAQSFEAGAALHTYFNVGDIHQIHLAGLADRDYLDKVTGYSRQSQNGDIRFAGEVDRIYLNTTDDVAIHDAALGRKINVAKAGSRSTVVWNPWRDRAATIRDFPDNGYETMVCVETTNAANDVRTIEPSETHTLTQIISLV